MNRVDRAIIELRKGNLIIVMDDEGRESEGDLVGISSLASTETVNFMVRKARGLICVPISARRSEQLELNLMTKANTDSFGTAFTVSVDSSKTKTGISAEERAQTIRELSSSNATSLDFNRPGHIFPLIGSAGGVLNREGHTEAALDLVELANGEDCAYICEILSEDGKMADRTELESLSKQWNMEMITVEELKGYIESTRTVTVEMPLLGSNFKLSTMFISGKEHMALTLGDVEDSNDYILTRIHSECLTGDVFGSNRCDCGEQLNHSIEMIATRGRGVLLYMRQEGRGIGIRNKMLSYNLQEKGRDTFDANIELGFEADERHYGDSIEILSSLGINKIDLITNNPSKIQELRDGGVLVRNVFPMAIKANKYNHSYMKTKKEKFNHNIILKENE